MRSSRDSIVFSPVGYARIERASIGCNSGVHGDDKINWNTEFEGLCVWEAQKVK